MPSKGRTNSPELRAWRLAARWNNPAAAAATLRENFVAKAAWSSALTTRMHFGLNRNRNHYKIQSSLNKSQRASFCVTPFKNF